MALGSYLNYNIKPALTPAIKPPEGINLDAKIK
jgi:hypothetical protein